MKVGVYFDLRRAPEADQSWARDYGFALEMCEEAEHLGAASVWFSEHHLFDDGYLPQPLTFAAAAAARTRRVRIGTAVLLAPLRHPLHIAEEAAVVDLISDGRLDLGLGAGYRAAEFAAFGADFAARFTTLDETVPRLREIWMSGAVLPQPVQRPVPLWLGYSGPRGARRAGRLGTGLLAVDPALVEPYLAGLREGGHDVASARTAGLVPAVVSEDPERDWPEVSRHHARQWDSYFRHAAPDGSPAPRIDPERARRRGYSPRNGALVYGTPEHVAATLNAQLAGRPVDTVLVWASIGAMLPERTARNVRTVLKRLAPLIATTPAEPAGKQHA